MQPVFICILFAGLVAIQATFTEYSNDESYVDNLEDEYHDVAKRTAYSTHYTYQYTNRNSYGGQCPKPGVPRGGLAWYQSRKVGSIVVYSCKPGYVLKGVRVRSCQNNGKWSQSIPKCTDSVKCEDPGKPDNSIRFLSSTKVNSIVKYKCKEGYRLAGSSYRVCQASGQWSGIAAKCLGTSCSSLSNPSNGNVNVPSRKVGSTAVYSCTTGYNLVGDESRVCRAGGSWSGTAPTCEAVDCGRLSNPQNGHVAFTSTVFGSTADYSCNNGFILVGSKQRQCQADGSWSRNAPICRTISCGRLDSPTNGKVVLSGMTPGSVATYSCNDGFQLRGIEQRNCLSNGQWGGSAPLCAAVVCESLVNIANGFITFSSTTVQRPGDKATYSCRNGYTLSDGDRVRVCQQDTTYTGTAPSCVAIICGPLRDPPNGRVRITDNSAGSQAVYSCNRGFILNGEDTRTCLSSGSYGGREPSCRPVDCGRLDTPSNGRVLITTTRLGGTAKYSCNDGFELQGGRIRRCGPNGDWTNRAPSCESVGCGQLSDPQNGRVHLRGTDVGSVASYICDDGFNLIGQRRRVCQRSSQWSGNMPSCQPISCEVLQPPQSGAVSVTGSTPGAVARYTCNNGFDLIGETERVCQDDGTYSLQAPICQLISCELLFNPANGQVSVSGGNRPGSTAKYVCNQGFTLDGLETRTCNSDGSYNGAAPVCRENSCGRLNNPLNGQVQFSSFSVGSVAAYSCNNGYSLVGVAQRICRPDGQWTGEEPRCAIVDCGILPEPLFGTVDFSSTTFLSKATYLCNDGFMLSEEVTRVCQANGQWSLSSPFCQPIACQRLTSPDNGFVIVRGNSIGAMATYTCNPGFRLIGIATRECLNDGSYSGQAPICEAIRCDILLSPNNGFVKFSNVIVGATASYACNKGSTLRGNTVRVCLPSGEWSGEEPTCSGVDCGDLEAPDNGAVNLGTTTFGSVAHYQCNSGYILTGENTRTCQTTGRWSGSDPVCQSVSCTPLDPPENGFVTFPSTTVGSVASYTCIPGFQLQGVNNRICHQGGEWSEEAPICLAISCGLLISPEYGSILVSGSSTNAIATYSCDNGFNIIGQSTRVCTSLGTWSGEAPSCQPQDCGNLDNPQDGVVDVAGTSFWDTATYRCNNGYQLIGEAIRSCQENGLWSGTAPYCSPVDCGFLVTPDNSRVSLTGTVINSIATYSCFPGYELVGDETRVCEANAQWAGQAPFCKATECGPLLDPRNGRVSFDGIIVYSIATYECDSGFGIKGAVSRMCRKDGSWTGSDPTCEPSDCGPLQSPVNGMVDTTGTRFSDTASYSCVPGYYVIGETTRTCDKSGVWTGIAPICQPVDCGNLNSPADGRVEFSSTIFRAFATYSCNFGFQLIGEMSRMCQDNGAWSGESPRCQRIMCDVLVVPGNSRLELSNGNLVGSTASYYCFPGYDLVGNNERTCQSNMQWTGTDPFCRGNKCSPLTDPIYGQVIFSSTSVGSVATYSCIPGHVLIGTNTRECLQQGVWSNAEPICERNECEVLFPIANGRVSLEGTSTNDQATYFCNNGYSLVDGDRVRTCLPSGEWSGQEPSCSAIQCPPLESPLNGLVNFDTSVGSIATYQCNINYELSNSSPRQCLPNGEWSGVAPICRAIDCGPLSDPANGNVRVAGTKFGNSARYGCFIGYVLEGDPIRVCSLDGTWSGIEPVCIESQCSELLDPLNGRVIVSGRTIGSIATYECNEGFTVNGLNTRICRDDQQWSGVAPLCRAIDCGRLFSPNNGKVEFSSSTFGSRASYTCNPGFDIIGDTVRTCQKNGVWSLQEPRCNKIIIECPRLTDPTNGNVAYSGNTPGSSATYTCIAGYSLTGDDFRFCQNDGTWTGNDPTCRSIDCITLGDPLNGKIRYIGSGFGAIVQYSCNQGFDLVGDNSRTCKSNGFWSGNEPICVEAAAPVNCGDPGIPSNGRKIGVDYSYGSVVYYECNDGYTLSGERERTCQFDGYWTGFLPVCNKNEEGECYGSGRVFDSCGRACRCENGQMVECCRLRRDYASFSDEEKERYLEAVLELSTNPLYKTRYIALLENYKASFDTDIYSTDPSKSQFFIWNRYFLIEYEDLLLEIDCHITLPFYDWTVLPLSPYVSIVWDDKYGFGKTSRANDYCVNSGSFKYPDYSLISSAGGTCLKREYKNQKFPSRSVIERDILTQPASEFNKFHRHLQLFIHTSVRCFIGGTMCSKDAANDPVFILHLAMLDYIYDRWQRFGEANLRMRFADDTSQLLLAPGHIVNEYYDNNNLPDNVAVCYDEPNVKSHVPIGHNFLAQSFSAVANRKDHSMGCLSRQELQSIDSHISVDDKKFIESKCDKKDDH